MGKALLVIVLGAGLVLTTQLLNVTEHESETAKDQTEYREEVIAREIAHSAFNVGMGVVRATGDDIQSGIRDLNGASGKGRSGSYKSGRFASGTYTVTAEQTSGHSVRIVATGVYGDAKYTMHDEYSVPVPVLSAQKDALLEVDFLESHASYCSAVFYQAYTPKMKAGTIPTPILLFPPAARHDLAEEPSQTVYAEAGTQMNFFIAVDKDCSTQLQFASLTECGTRGKAQGYSFSASDFDYLHYALDVEAGALDRAKESSWAFVHQKPGDTQRWRIAWEDMHFAEWTNPAEADKDNPEQSLEALKRLGYDGTGWTMVGAYTLLQDFWLRSGQPSNGRSTSYRPDFAAQVIEARLVSSDAPNFFGQMTAARAKQAKCGEEIDEPITNVPDEVPAEVQEQLQEIEQAGGTNVVETPVVTPDDPLTTFACSCTNNGQNNKTAIIHRPPGNESNEQYLCVGTPSVANAHMKNHNDSFPSCTARLNVQSNNKNK